VLLALLASQVVAMAQGSASTVASSPACSVASWWSSSAIDLAEVPTGESVHTEVALAYNVHTGAARLLAPRGHRDYAGRTATEITGTADLFYQRGTRWVCRDWKTARWEEPPSLSSS
jgi:hypothetical protein